MAAILICEPAIGGRTKIEWHSNILMHLCAFYSANRNTGSSSKMAACGVVDKHIHWIKDRSVSSSRTWGNGGAASETRQLTIYLCYNSGLPQQWSEGVWWLDEKDKDYMRAVHSLYMYMIGKLTIQWGDADTIITWLFPPITTYNGQCVWIFYREWAPSVVETGTAPPGSIAGEHLTAASRWTGRWNR